MTNHPARTRVLDRVHNFRDYGGYAVSGGGQVVRGMLWRSGQHFGATDDDLKHIDALRLAAIVDLRGPKERAKAPNPALPRSQPRIFETAMDTANLMLKVNPVMRTEGSLAEVDAAMCAGYRVMPFNPALIDIFSDHFHALATVEGAQLVHCLAGKDRTGLAVALTQHLLGVHHDDIMADYLLTNTAGNIEERIAAGVKAIRAAHSD
ncbi:MAG: tyrosine-protein phosphatase, partial [Alphaproteobacteria bacterium]|nr:tyrosine-protein phosphatase [Alphaproteobacteria bacterium]